MTSIVFRTFGNISAITKQNQMNMEFEGCTAEDFLNKLIEKFGEDMKKILFPGGSLSDLIFILINGRNIEGLEGLETKIKDGDTVSVLPMTAGG
ncbi:MoaD family protein [Candidatus Methanomassiliicoccus intestinalis]|uniref:Molybdopterin converting factor, small subunit n=1 Tax=Methanomassiliicoccus intestinalis (strain Issoire-Mx1) TaxID=1295009 RepID=R9T8W5_METII|nr:MoaD family protein [Candidatus Methanomassiliicoccus intestinalis]AGN25808.1 molybdopterin converting factor, small subunit [Candidatus Methanomassiliicoccus intestinalis Issoire-Mx1]